MTDYIRMISGACEGLVGCSSSSPRNTHTLGGEGKGSATHQSSPSRGDHAGMTTSGSCSCTDYNHEEVGGGRSDGGAE